MGVGMTGVCAAVAVVVAVVVSGCGGVDVCTKHLYKPDSSAYFPVSALAASAGEPYKVEGVVGEEGTVYDYVFNFCEAVPCDNKGDALAGCQNYTDSRNHFRGLGQVASVTFETVVPNQAVGFTASYTDGTECNDLDASGSRVARSMRIFAICSPDHVVPAVSFLGETGYCEYDFQILAANGPCPIDVGEPTTPPACHSDRKLIVTPATASNSANIEYYYPVWELEQSLNAPLAVATTILGAPFEFELNVCAPVSCPASGAAAPAACAHGGHDGSMFSLGELATVAVTPYADGDAAGSVSVDAMDGFRVAYTGGESCDGESATSSVVINVVCDVLMRDVDEPRVEFVSQSTACAFEFNVYSHLGCPLPLSPSDVPATMYGACPSTVSTGRGFHYDLTPLTTAYDAPYVASDARFEPMREYKFNLCGAAQCEYLDCGDAKCHKVESSSVLPDDTAACVMWADASGTVHGIVSGSRLATHATYARPDLSGFSVEYINGDACPSDEANNVEPALRGRRTIVHAICDPTHSGFPLVRFVSESHSPCVTVLTLTSQHACPIADRPRVRTTCAQASLFSSESGMVFPFHKLSQAFSVSANFDGVEHEYVFSLCDPVPCAAPANPAPLPTVCHIETPPSAAPTTTVLGTVSSTTFAAHDANDGYTVLFDAPPGEDESAGVLVHVKCDPGRATPEASFVGVSAHGMVQLMIEADEGACMEPYAGTTTSPTTTNGKHPVAGNTAHSTHSFTIIAVLAVIVVSVSCFALVGLKIYKNSHPDSALPDPTAPLAACPGCSCLDAAMTSSFAAHPQSAALDLSADAFSDHSADSRASRSSRSSRASRSASDADDAGAIAAILANGSDASV